MKKVILQVFRFSIIFGLFFFAGCAKYHPMPLFKPAGIAQEKNGIIITTAKLSQKEKAFVFDKKLSSKKFQSIQIMVENRGRDPIELSASHIHLNLESMLTLKKTAHYNTVGRAFGFGTLGCFLLGPPGLFGMAWGFSSNSSNTNKKMDINFDQTIIALGSEIKILPTEKINKVMFIPAFTLVESYKISFVNITTHQVTTFNCNI